MQRTCDGNDPNLIGKDGGQCNCGLTFDDVYHLVIYPHTKFEVLGLSDIDKIHQLYSKYIEDAG